MEQKLHKPTGWMKTIQVRMIAAAVLTAVIFAMFSSVTTGLDRFCKLQELAKEWTVIDAQADGVVSTGQPRRVSIINREVQMLAIPGREEKEMQLCTRRMGAGGILLLIGQIGFICGMFLNRRSMERKMNRSGVMFYRQKMKNTTWLLI